MLRAQLEHSTKQGEQGQRLTTTPREAYLGFLQRKGHRSGAKLARLCAPLKAPRCGYSCDPPAT